MRFRYVAALLAMISIRAKAQVFNGDAVRLRPATVPTACVIGELRVDSSSGYSLQICTASGSWALVGGSSTPAYAEASGTASYATASATASTSGTAAYSVLSGTADYAAVSGTASYAATSGTASYAATSGTASYSDVSGTASYAATSGTASYATTSGAFSGTNITATKVVSTDGSKTIDFTTGIVIDSASGDVNINSNASGVVNYGANNFRIFAVSGTTPAIVTLYKNGGAYYTAFRPSSSITSNTTYSLPVNYGTSGQFLQTDGAGVMSWALPTSDNNPVGTVIMYGGSTCPSTYLVMDGSAISRATYSTLFTVMSTTYGTGDGTSTFNLPNTQGVFIRGSGSQTISAIAYTGTRGTTQGDQFQGHKHRLKDSGGNYACSNYGSGYTNGIPWTNIGSSSGFACYGDDIEANGTDGTPRSGTESRPANITLLYCIKAT